MPRLNPQPNPADKKGMRRPARTKTIAFPGETILFGFLFFLVAVMFSSRAFGADQPESCQRLEILTGQRDEYTTKLTELTAKAESDTNYKVQADLAAAQLTQIEASYSGLDSQCRTDKARAEKENSDCVNGHKSNPDLYIIHADKSCTMKDVGSKSNPNEGECSAAELLRGTNLKGEACQNTAQTIKSTQSMSEAVTGATTAAVTGYSSYQATMATGAQADAQLQQKKILQSLAISKIATGALQLTNAVRLRSAAGKADTSASDISSAHQALRAKCDQAESAENITSEQCFYKYARSFQINNDQVEYNNFERMRVAENQTKDQADRAKELAKASMVSGAADAIVGIQAMMMARQAQQNGVQMGAPPPPPGTPGYAFSGASQGGFSNAGATPVVAGGLPTDFGNGGGDGTTLGDGGGPVQNSIKGGGNFGTSTFTPAKSTVSTASGGGGGGVGGGGGKGGSRSPGHGGQLAETGKDQFNLGGGGGGGFRGSNGPAEQAEGGNAFAEALSKLFPQDQNGKPVVEARQLASEGGDIMEGAFAGSDVQAVDISLFEQISTKYRQLAGSGSI